LATQREVIQVRRTSRSAARDATFQYQWDGDLLRVTVEGRVQSAAAARLTEEIGTLGQGTELRRVICDCRLATVVIDALSMSRHVMQLSRNEVLLPVRIALLVGARLNSFTYLEELAAHYALQLRVFTDGVLAEQWLDEGPPQMAAAS
jgi:hypothetical protein